MFLNKKSPYRKTWIFKNKHWFRLGQLCIFEKKRCFLTGYFCFHEKISDRGNYIFKEKHCFQTENYRCSYSTTYIFFILVLKKRVFIYNLILLLKNNVSVRKTCRLKSKHCYPVSIPLFLEKARCPYTKIYILKSKHCFLTQKKVNVIKALFAVRKTFVAF